MGLFEDLRQLSDQVKKRQPHIKGEEATKQALILPFLQVLGYDIYDPIELKPEYAADFPGSKGGPAEKVDYAVHLGGKVAMLIECKAADAKLSDHDGQLSRYFNATTSCRLGIITNGIEYRFFTDLHAPNVMDSTPFYVLNILTFNERDAEAVRPFTRDAFDGAGVTLHAEDLIFGKKVTALINGMLRNPSENFVRFLVKEVQVVGTVTQKVVDRFVPIVRKAIQTTLVDMMASSIQQELASPHRDEAAVGQAVSAVPQNQEPASPAAAEQVAVAKVPQAPETTEEELQMFDLVRTICSESPIKRDIAYTDSLNYFAIHLGKPGQWFARIVANPKRKALLLRLPVDQVASLAEGFKVEEPPKNFGTSRVFFDASVDLVKLRRVLIAAFEAEIARQDSGVKDSAEVEAATSPVGA